MTNACPSNDPYDTECLKAAVEGAALTSEQNKLAEDFCTPCATSIGQTVSQCLATFWGLADGGTVVGTGGVWLQASDAILARIDSTCVPALSGGSATACGDFQGCGSELYSAATTFPTPAACTSWTRGRRRRGLRRRVTTPDATAAASPHHALQRRHDGY